MSESVVFEAKPSDHTESINNVIKKAEKLKALLVEVHELIHDLKNGESVLNKQGKTMMHVYIDIAGRQDAVAVKCASEIIEAMKKEHGSNHVLLFDIKIKT